MPSNTAAWLEDAGSEQLKVGSAPYHEPGPDELVLRTGAVAINPVDWKMQDRGLFIKKYPTVFGCDVAGTVVDIGSAVKEFSPGDRVISNAVCLTKGPEYAAFQDYVKCPTNVTAKLPTNMSMEQGCVLPLAVNTAALGLFGADYLALPLPSLKPVSREDCVFIYGGSSSVGSTAIQLARAAGLRVIATASKRNHEHCKALGAEKVYDYHDADWVDSVVVDLTHANVLGAYDAVSHADTTSKCAEVLAKTSSTGKIVGTNPTSGGTASQAVFGTDMTLSDALARSIWHDFLQPALESGLFQPQPQPRIVGNGLGEVQKAMDLQRKGVSATKLVVKME